jgi:putative nucleotidyltransferase with HDIG domain
MQELGKKFQQQNFTIVHPEQGPHPEWFVMLLNAKDSISGQHIVRVFQTLNEWLSDLENRGQVTKAERTQWSLAGLLHDIGKIAVSDVVLGKRGALDPVERVEMERHVQLGYEMLRDIPEYNEIADLVRAHHERWDGHGYPFRLKQDRIPLGAQYIAIVDAFDAMTAKRPYRKSLNEPEALKEIEQCAGSQFNPALALDFVRFRRARNQ